MNLPELTLEREYKSLDNRQIEDENTDEFYPFNILIKIDNKKIVLGNKYFWELDNRGTTSFTMKIIMH